MKIKKINDMWRGWFIGDFEPSVLKTKEFEVGVLTHKKGEKQQAFCKFVLNYYYLIYLLFLRQGM